MAGARLFQVRDTLAELTKGDPVNARTRVRGRIVQIRKGFFLDRDDGDVVAHRPRRIEHEERKSPVAGDEA